MIQTLTKALLIWFMLFMLLQPLYSHIDYLLDVTVKANNAYIAEKAAPLGSVTPALYQEAVQNLTAVGFLPSEIEIEYESVVRERGESIEVVTRVQRASPFVFNFTGTSFNTYYYAHNVVMSEFLD